LNLDERQYPSKQFEGIFSIPKPKTLLPLKRLYRHRVHDDKPDADDQQIMGNITQAGAFKGNVAHSFIQVG